MCTPALNPAHPQRHTLAQEYFFMSSGIEYNKHDSLRSITHYTLQITKKTYISHPYKWGFCEHFHFIYINTLYLRAITDVSGGKLRKFY
jgi:hypothetical protein